jgi:uncharacterized membrane protein
MRRSGLHTLLLVGVLLWCFLIVTPPLWLLLNPSSPEIADSFYRSFSVICHQYDSRSLHIEGHKLAVCGRCSAIYFGFLAGVFAVRFLSRPLISRGLAWWILAATPMVIDVALDSMGFSASTTATRLVTGGIFGVIAAFILTPHFIQGCLEIIHPSAQGIAYGRKAR